MPLCLCEFGVRILGAIICNHMSECRDDRLCPPARSRGRAANTRPLNTCVLNTAAPEVPSPPVVFVTSEPRRVLDLSEGFPPLALTLTSPLLRFHSSDCAGSVRAGPIAHPLAWCALGRRLQVGPSSQSVCVPVCRRAWGRLGEWAVQVPKQSAPVRSGGQTQR